MDKFRQYRFLKRVEKLLNSPASPPEIYESSTSTRYVGDTSARHASHNANPDENLKVRQTIEVIGLLLRQIDLVTGRDGERDPEKDQEELWSEFARISANVAIKFCEIEKGIIMTEPEKVAVVERWRQKLSAPADARRPYVDFTQDRTRLTDLQKELGAKKRKVYWVDRKLGEVGANVHDFRLKEFAKDRRKGMAELNACTKKSVLLCREVEVRLNAMWYRELT